MVGRVRSEPSSAIHGIPYCRLVDDLSVEVMHLGEKTIHVCKPALKYVKRLGAQSSFLCTSSIPCLKRKQSMQLIAKHLLHLVQELGKSPGLLMQMPLEVR